LARLDQVFQSTAAYYDDDFLQTQFRILQSRTLAKRTIDAMKLWMRRALAKGPEPKGSIQLQRHGVVGESTASSDSRRSPSNQDGRAAG